MGQISPTTLDFHLNKAANTTLVTEGASGSVMFAVVTGSLPANLTLAPTGVILGTPTVPGPYSFVLTATDEAGSVVTQSYSGVVRVSAEQRMDHLLAVVAAAFNTIKDNDTAFISFDGPQELTDAQRAQAQANLGLSSAQAQQSAPADQDYASKFVGLLADPNVKAAAAAALPGATATA
jgi:hypothetical protein